MWDRIFAGLDQRQLKFWAAYLGIGVLFTLIFYVWIPNARYALTVTESKQNAHAVQLALERFSVDSQSGHYPPSFAEVIEQGYVVKPIINPFTRQPIKVVVSPEDASKGDVVYMPIYSGSSRPNLPCAYELAVSF